jgi:hypothetical protein
LTELFQYFWWLTVNLKGFGPGKATPFKLARGTSGHQAKGESSSVTDAGYLSFTNGVIK